MLIIGGPGSGKINALLNFVKEQDSYNLIDKVYLYAKDLNEPKYRFLIETLEDVGVEQLNDPKSFTEHSNTVDDVYNNIDGNNLNRKTKILTVFHDMIADIMNNKKLKPKLKIFLLQMQQTEYISCIYHIVSFFCCKRSLKIKFCTLPNNEDL